MKHFVLSSERRQWPFRMTMSGRAGEILYQEGERTLRIEWEMSGSAELDLLLAPLRLGEWTSEPSAIPKEKQREILKRLREWLSYRGLRSDIDLPPDAADSDQTCLWQDCSARQLAGSAYCREHFDETLLSQ